MWTIDSFELALVVGWILLSLVVIWIQDRAITRLEQENIKLAEGIRDRFYEAYPDIRRWHQNIQRKGL